MNLPEPPASSREEEVLLEGLRRGDEAAYERIVRLYSGRLLAVAKRMLPSDDDARDAVQQAFVSAVGAMRDFQGESRISTWLHRIVVNAALMKLRTRRRKPEEPIDALLPSFLSDGHFAAPVDEWRESATESLERGELREQVRQHIDRLPDTYREVLILRDIEEFDTAEAAELLGISSNAVKTRLHRARQALRELLVSSIGKDRS